MHGCCRAVAAIGFVERSRCAAVDGGSVLFGLVKGRALVAHTDSLVLCFNREDGFMTRLYSDGW